jgi:hypothetical protein
LNPRVSLPEKPLPAPNGHFTPQGDLLGVVPKKKDFLDTRKSGNHHTIRNKEKSGIHQ